MRLRGFNTQNGGVYGRAGISGGTGRAARFENVNAANSGGTGWRVVTNGGGNLAVFATSGNVAKLMPAVKVFFNGGTQTSSADVANFF